MHNAWVTLNAPIFYGFKDRIEILSFGDLPPDQTIDGFFQGKSVPVNPKLAEIFLQLRISERMGRGVPRITSVYGRDNFDISEKSIVVKITYDGMYNYDNDMPEAQVNGAKDGVDNIKNNVNDINNWM